MSMANWQDPDSATYRVCSAIVLAMSLYGRHFCRKNGMPCGLFTINIVLLPVYYYAAFKYKHVDMNFSPYKPRPTFNECLEFYPTTRRAFKRALLLREKEMQEIRGRV